MLDISSAAIIEKNKIATDGVWLVLLEVAMPDGTNMKVVRNNEDITWNGEKYIAFPFEIDEISENRNGEIPQFVIRVSNITRAVQTYLEQGSGGVGSTAYLRVVNSKNLAATKPEVELAFTCTGCKADSKWVSFTLGAFNVFNRRFPQRRILRNFCPWKNLGDCQYVATCKKTLTDCRNHGMSAIFGGFAGVVRGGFYA